MAKQHSMYDDWTEPENLILIQGGSGTVNQRRDCQEHWY